MNKKAYIILAAVVVIATGAYLWSRQHVASPESARTPDIVGAESVASSTDTETVAEAADLYFTTKGCTSDPYVTALGEGGMPRQSDAVIAAPDGYNYAILPDTRAKRTMHSHFNGTCEDTSATELDSYQAFEVGATESEQ